MQLPNENEWMTKDILIVGAIILCLGVACAVLGYWSYRAWVWSVFELARHWGFL